jgi:hypothetical protein
MGRCGYGPVLHHAMGRDLPGQVELKGQGSLGQIVSNHHHFAMRVTVPHSCDPANAGTGRSGLGPWIMRLDGGTHRAVIAHRAHPSAGFRQGGARAVRGRR